MKNDVRHATNATIQTDARAEDEKRELVNVQPRFRNIVLFGPPGVGKGAQARILSEAFGFPHLSTGEVLREEIKRGSELGLRVKDSVEQGKFADDQTVLGIISDRIDLPDYESGFVMDGFPRNIHQAEMLDGMLADRERQIDCALFISAPEQVILDRLAGRLICSSCGRTYHAVFKKPQAPGVCDICEGKVVKRHDDGPETHRERLRTYEVRTKPLADFYREAGTLRNINGNQSIEEVSNEIIRSLG